MPRLLFRVGRALAMLAAMVVPPATAQSTDGYHALQVFPVVVDTSSFTQRFHFRRLFIGTTTVLPTYFPASGTIQSAVLACPPFEIVSIERSFATLRELCPDLPAGSHFGFLTLAATGDAVFSGFSRVSNPAGAGFTVEAFPAHTFTPAYASVPGLRRTSASAGAPAYQSNCFIGRMNRLAPAGPAGMMRVFYGLGTQAGEPIGTTRVLDLAPGQMVRLLDVFQAVGAAAGDHPDASFRFGAAPPLGELGALLGFCTVQENTSFGADFRVAKSEYGGCWGSESCDWVNPLDEHVNRETVTGSDLHLAGEIAGRAFAIPSGKAQNSHVFYFRHPDWIGCELLDPASRQRLAPGFGLEMRLTNNSGYTIAGGDGVTGFARLYLGDKTSPNSRYALQVESNEENEGVARPYLIRCGSGSGHTPGDTVRFNAALDQF